VYRINLPVGSSVVGSTDGLLSETGAFTVASTVVVRDLVYVSSDYVADLADNTSTTTAPTVGVVWGKPTTVTATILFWGRMTGFSGLPAGEELFLGASGQVITKASLPTTPGSVIQKVGFALSTTDAFITPQLPIVL